MQSQHLPLLRKSEGQGRAGRLPLRRAPHALGSARRTRRAIQRLMRPQSGCVLGDLEGSGGCIPYSVPYCGVLFLQGVFLSCSVIKFS